MPDMVLLLVLLHHLAPVEVEVEVGDHLVLALLLVQVVLAQALLLVQVVLAQALLLVQVLLVVDQVLLKQEHTQMNQFSQHVELL